jgi:hypothetical protein
MPADRQEKNIGYRLRRRRQRPPVPNLPEDVLKERFIVMGVECVIFDVMGVLFPVGDDVNDLLVPFIQAHHAQITSADIHALYLAASLGRISSETFWNSCGIPGVGPKDLEYSYLSSCLEPDTAYFPVAETLRREDFV